jgi:hypothetical protein
MKNAYLRFAHLSYQRIMKKTSTRFRVPIDRFIGEPGAAGEARAHLLSMIGGDTQIAALGAAVTLGESFSVETSAGPLRVSLGTAAESYRGSLVLERGRRPLRHLVAVSQELAQTGMGRNPERTILCHDSPSFVWTALVEIHGLPGAGQWAEWMMNELRRLKKIEPLIGVGCSPVLVHGGRELFLRCIARGLRKRAIVFPKENGALEWPRVALPEILLPAAAQA